MFLKGYSLTVEPWSSKSYVWVRFLLPLLFKVKNFNNNKIRLQKFKIIPILNKNKYFNKIFYSRRLFYKNSNLSFLFFKTPSPSSDHYRIANNNHFFYLKNFFFFKKTPNVLTINTVLFFYQIFPKNRHFFLFNFLHLFNTFGISFFKIYCFLNNNYYYFFYYLNSFIFLNKNTHAVGHFFSNDAENRLMTFHSFRSNRVQSFSLKIENRWPRSNKTQLIIKVFEKFKTNYLFLTKLFFFNFKTFLKLKKKQLISLFKLNSFDWINDDMARLTRQSFLLDFSDYFYYKNVFSNVNFYHNRLNAILDFSSYSDNFFENNLFFCVFTDKNFSNRASLLNSTPAFDSHNNENLSEKTTNFMINFKSNTPVHSVNSLKSLKNFNIFINKSEILLFLFTKPLFFKYLSLKKPLNTVFNFNPMNSLIKYFSDYFFYNKQSLFFNNFIPMLNFSYKIKKYILKIFNYNKFSITTALWCYTTLIKFLEFFSGKKTYLQFRPFINNILDFHEKAQCLLWAQKVKYYRKMLGPRLFLNESLQIIYLSLKYKDPFILSNWMSATMQKISFWKYKTFLRYIKYVLRYFFWVIFKQLNVKGIKYQLKGKVSVAGNARTRTVFHTVGFTSHTTFDNKILYKLNLVKTFTGVLGFKLWIVF